MIDQTFEIKPLDKNVHNRAAFSCGEVELDAYLQTQSSQDKKRLSSVIYVGVVDTSKIVGYYSLSQFSIELNAIPDDIAKHLSTYPQLPATLLGRLAVHTEAQGEGYGEILLFDALQRTLEVSTHIASCAVVVDVKNDKARSFYMKYGFIRVIDVDNRLMLPMKTIARMFARSSIASALASFDKG
jgi:predicted GNAT family N-acyltransferase